MDSPPQAPALSARNISKAFNGVWILDRVSLDVATGETVCVVGPSGSGKSTFLRCLAWLSPPTSGEVLLGADRIGFLSGGANARPIAAAALRAQRARIGYVFQSFNLWPHRTVLGNVTEGLRVVKKLDRIQAEAKAREMLSLVGLAEKLDAYPARLSGGQQQRVAIARALAMEPAVLLFDEPTSALDPELVGEVLDAIKDLASRKITMVIVTHEMGFAAEVADRIVFMDQGRIVEIADPISFFRAPREIRSQQFLKRTLSRYAVGGLPAARS